MIQKKICETRKTLKNEVLVAKIGVDTERGVKNNSKIQEPKKVVDPFTVNLTEGKRVTKRGSRY